MRSSISRTCGSHSSSRELPVSVSGSSNVRRLHRSHRRASWADGTQAAAASQHRQRRATGAVVRPQARRRSSGSALSASSSCLTRVEGGVFVCPAGASLDPAITAHHVCTSREVRCEPRSSDTALRDPLDDAFSLTRSSDGGNRCGPIRVLRVARPVMRGSHCGKCPRSPARRSGGRSSARPRHRLLRLARSSRHPPRPPPLRGSGSPRRATAAGLRAPPQPEGWFLGVPVRGSRSQLKGAAAP